MSHEAHTAHQEPIPEDASYEELVGLLESTVARLESGELSLEDAVLEYERGMQLIERCNQMLDSAELRITELSNRVAGNTGADVE